MAIAAQSANMKLVIVSILALTAANELPAARLSHKAPAGPIHAAEKKTEKFYYRILKKDFSLHNDQSYDSSYETENGISASESGRPVTGGGDGRSFTVQGQYSYTGDDRVTYRVTYVADEDGFRPQGDHLPTAVPTQYPTPEVPVTQSRYQAVSVLSYR